MLPFSQHGGDISDTRLVSVPVEKVLRAFSSRGHGSSFKGKCIRAAVLVQNTVPELTDHWRQVVYACYQPRSFAREEDLRLKAQAWEEYRVTTHWPARNVHLFPKSQPGKGVTTVLCQSALGKCNAFWQL